MQMETLPWPEIGEKVEVVLNESVVVWDELTPDSPKIMLPQGSKVTLRTYEGFGIVLSRGKVVGRY